jgi:hypothetical protein
MDTSSSSSSGDDDEMHAEARASSEQIAPPALQPQQPQQQQLLLPQERIAAPYGSGSVCSSEDELEDVPSLDASLLQQHYGFSGARQVLHLREIVPYPLLVASSRHLYSDAVAARHATCAAALVPLFHFLPAGNCSTHSLPVLTIVGRFQF